TANGWFAARPSGTEDVYKLYAESFLGADHLRKIQEEAQALIARVFPSPGREVLGKMDTSSRSMGSHDVP
ncbi:MAG: hypothetical protein ACYC37_12085, partial [Desulfobacteria bacterium]